MSTSALPVADYYEEEQEDKPSTGAIDLVEFRRLNDAVPPADESSEYLTHILPIKGLGRALTPVSTAAYAPPLLPVISKISRRANYFTSLQKWEGTVLEISKDAFLGRLVDQTNPGADEEAEFSLAEISEEDKELLAPGAVFYWNIGYNDSPSGQRTRVSVIRFRRLPAWSEREIRDAKQKAEQLRDRIGWK